MKKTTPLDNPLHVPSPPHDPAAVATARGRRRDHGRDAVILDAVIDVLAEHGYEGMTMDLVAQRAKAGKATVYRRWKSKADLVVDAVAHAKRGQVDPAALPDTGTLRGDLLALFKPSSVKEGERTLQLMAGLAAVLAQHPELADAGNAAIVEPWVVANRVLMRRALARGELSAHADIECAAQVVPSMAAYRVLIQRKPFDLAFLVRMLDGLLLPALCNAPAASEPGDRHVQGER
ncbi:TetR/AcrR family transcriptional regulator [Xanthomonas sp. NCPPB 1638]|uniref:TetR family transcriptional regulator n=1 Tax=Xanthomonas cucurbitae TaxID=56453 RepID=A0A2S7DW21_9XANT|nr:TetR/AcrR family transcriptional regulator [Xanthomonas cucurbitae]PPU77995.1 TetR family transcriptional regulator [Xanthomonas cucurbitae]QHG86080.1 TetR/AcrR family transcriptional regulator [Xanthomonas cucurbitae]WDM75993.1 TetR/AcrR family transcriptional regulator [Xanthomonas cucurbitae]WDM78581.1 TetR/AcrR family transcriptional regulator [Xanthomonas cucurbitae]WDM82260.1 TetR/AcrR family transcriptional regulator [Xanthomonas cucurbitae]